MKLKSKILFDALLPILFLIFSQPLNAREVTSGGYGYNRDAAVTAALRNAVEKCVGVSIGSKTLVENFSLVSDKIISKTSGYVSRYDVKEEKEEFGLVKVVVEADVALGKLESDLAAQKLLYKMVNQPRIMVLLDERMNNDVMLQKTASYKFEQILTSKGFIVVEPEQAAKIQGSEDNRQLADIAFRNGADLLIRGSVSVEKATPITIYGTQFYTVPIQFNARIVRSDNAQILVSRTKRTRKNATEEASAAHFGLETGGKELAEELIADLNKYWQSEAYNESRVVLALRDFPIDDMTVIEQKLLKISSIRDLQLRYIEENDVLYDIDLRGSINDLKVSAVKLFQQASIRELSSHRMVLQKGTAQGETIYNPEEAGVEITAFSLKDIFPAQIRFYENNPLAVLKVACPDIRNLKVSVIIPEMMSLPAETHLEQLSSGKSHKLSLNLILDRDKVLENNDTRTVYGQAVISYSVNGKEIEKKLTAPVKVHEKNAMDWGIEEAIGGFVTYTDPVIADLASRAILSVNSSGSYNRGLLHSMALFQVIKQLGIKYVKDPAALRGKALIDKVQFPAQTLKRQAGDCDDLAVLYASLLSSVGIHAAIISYSDHVLVMFDTEIYKKNRYILSSDSIFTIEHNGTLWIPVEITMPAEGFSKAWQTASIEFHNALAEKNSISIIDLQKAWSRFPPAPLKKTEISLALEGLQQSIDSEAGKLKKISEESLAGALQKLEQNSKKGETNSAKLLNSKGILYLRQKMIKEAKMNFQQASKKQRSPEFSSNYAGALLLEGEETASVKILDSIYKQDASGRVAVNRALCYYVKATTGPESEQFINALKEAVSMMPSSEYLTRYLGIDLSDEVSPKAAEIEQSADGKEVNLRRLKELIRQRVLSTPQNEGSTVGGTTTETSTGTRSADKAPVVLPYGGIRGADPQQVSKIAELLYWFE